MKKIISCICLIGIVLCGFAVPVSAQENTNEIVKVEKIENGEIQYLADGTSVEIRLYQTATLRASGRTDGHKDYTVRNNDGEILWVATIKGSFTYNGSSATCTSASFEISIKNSSWKLDSKSEGKSGNCAYTNYTMKRYFVGVPVQTEDKYVELRCSANGTIS